MAPVTYDILSPLELAPPAPSSSSLNLEPVSSANSLPSPPTTFERRTRRALAAADAPGSSWQQAATGGGGTTGVEVRALARRSLAPNDTQKVTLGVIGAYVVLIAVLWVVPYIKWVLWPFKIFTILIHEFGHASTGCCTGAKIKSISLDPREGGVTMMSGGWPALTLSSGYLGSALAGALFVFCGFDIVASKVASIVIGLGFALSLWWGRKDWLTIFTIVLATGLIVGFWFIAHGAALRFYVLFLGVMSSMYSTFDIYDDLISRKVNESDASVFAKRYGGSSACWGVIWASLSLLFAAAAIVGGLAAFKQSFSEQATDGAAFLPTRFM